MSLATPAPPPGLTGAALRPHERPTWSRRAMGAAEPCPGQPSPSSGMEPCPALCQPAAGTFQPDHGPAGCTSPALPALTYPLPTSLTAAELHRNHAGRTVCARHSLEHGASSSCTVREHFLSPSIGKLEASGLSTACCQQCLRSWQVTGPSWSHPALCPGLRPPSGSVPSPRPCSLEGLPQVTPLPTPGRAGSC